MLTAKGDAIVEVVMFLVRVASLVLIPWALVARFGWLDGAAISLAGFALLRAFRARELRDV